MLTRGAATALVTITTMIVAVLYICQLPVSVVYGTASHTTWQLKLAPQQGKRALSDRSTNRLNARSWKANERLGHTNYPVHIQHKYLFNKGVSLTLPVDISIAGPLTITAPRSNISSSTINDKFRNRFNPTRSTKATTQVATSQPRLLLLANALATEQEEGKLYKCPGPYVHEAYDLPSMIKESPSHKQTDNISSVGWLSRQGADSIYAGFPPVYVLSKIAVTTDDATTLQLLSGTTLPSVQNGIDTANLLRAPEMLSGNQNYLHDFVSLLVWVVLLQLTWPSCTLPSKFAIACRRLRNNRRKHARLSKALRIHLYKALLCAVLDIKPPLCMHHRLAGYNHTRAAIIYTPPYTFYDHQFLADQWYKPCYGGGGQPNTHRATTKPICTSSMRRLEADSATWLEHIHDMLTSPNNEHVSYDAHSQRFAVSNDMLNICRAALRATNTDWRATRTRSASELNGTGLDDAYRHVAVMRPNWVPLTDAGHIRILHSTGDGACLFNSTSILLSGHEGYNYTLRLHTLIELLTNIEAYTAPDRWAFVESHRMARSTQVY